MDKKENRYNLRLNDELGDFIKVQSKLLGLSGINTIRYIISQYKKHKENVGEAPTEKDLEILDNYFTFKGNRIFDSTKNYGDFYLDLSELKKAVRDKNYPKAKELLTKLENLRTVARRNNGLIGDQNYEIISDSLNEFMYKYKDDFLNLEAKYLGASKE